MTSERAQIARLAKTFANMAYRIEELERRVANVARPGKVTAVDPANGLVKLEVGELPTAWVPWLETSGAIKSWRPPSVGQQMMLISPSGEPGQGWAMPAGASNANPHPHNKVAEDVLTIGQSRIQVTGGSIEFTVGKSSIVMTADAIDVTADDTINMTSETMIADADVHLGGEGGEPLHRRGDVDSGGDVAVGHAQRVFAT